jgi:hypothetical protein
MTKRKEDENFNFILHKKYNINKIKLHVSKYTDHEWLLNQTRQNETVHHTKTQSYFISYFELIDDFSNYVPRINEDVDPILIEMIMPIIKDMENIYNGKFGRIFLIKLPQESDITPHFDDDEYFNLTRRFHLPIITNEMVDFYVNDEVKNMKEGECWEINNRKIHKVINRSSDERVHLLFDIIPGNIL